MLRHKIKAGDLAVQRRDVINYDLNYAKISI